MSNAPQTTDQLIALASEPGLTFWQVGGLILVGAFFGFVAGVFIFKAMVEPQWRWKGWIIAAICSPACLGFYSWAALRHPLEAWGLR